MPPYGVSFVLILVFFFTHIVQVCFTGAGAIISNASEQCSLQRHQMTTKTSIFCRLFVQKFTQTDIEGNEGNLPVIGGFPTQRASDAENV